jgi:Pyruvate/2-oxoacid:ferredoxin oxidoreductase gamma subunit
MAKKVRIPKRVFGAKVPKLLRKSKMMRSLLHSPLGRDMLANAITAAAAAAATVLVEERETIAEAGSRGAKKGARAMGIAGEAVQSAAAAAMQVVGEAARSVLPEQQPKRKDRGKAAVRH